MNFTKRLINDVDYLTKNCTLEELDYSFNFNRQICNINPDQMTGEMFERMLSIGLAMYHKYLSAETIEVEQQKLRRCKEDQ